MRTVYLCIIIFVYSFSVLGQEPTIDIQRLKRKGVYVKSENLSLENVISALAKSFDIHFVYRPDMLKRIKVNILLNWIPLEEALRKLLYPLGFTYFFEPDGRVIILSASQERWSLTGRIFDAATSKPLSGVNIYIEETTLGDATKDDGAYRIDNIPPGVHTLVVRMVGYKQQTERIFHEGKKVVRRDFTLEQETIRGQEVEVVAEREKFMVKEEPGRYSLQQQTISIIPSHGEKDVFRTLQALPGVIMTSEYKSQLYIRGGNSDQNLVLLDGCLIYNPFHFSGILSAIDVDAIDEVDFFAGAFPAEYGGRLSSVLDIKTRKGADTFKGKFNLSPISAKLMIEGPVSRWGNFLFTGRRSYINYVAKRIGGDFVPDFYDFMGRIEVRPTWRDRIILTGFWEQDSVRIDKTKYMEGMTNRTLGSAFNYQRTFSNRFKTSLRTTYGEFITRAPQALTRHEPQKSRAEDISGDFKMELFVSDGLEFVVGSNYRQIRIKYTSADPVVPELKIDERLHELAFFIRNHLKIKDRWIFNTGLRVNRYDKGKPFIVEPRFNMQYNMYNFLTLKGAYGRFSQSLVTIYNENDTYNPVEIWLPPDQDLPASIGDHVIVGCFYKIPSMMISLEAYWKKYRHLTHYNRERLYPEDPFFVQGKGNAVGLDVFMQWVHEKWQLWMSYSLAKATKTLPVQYPEPGTVKFAPRYDRRHNLNALLEYQFFKGLLCSMRFNIGSGLPFSFMIGGYNRWSTWVIDHTADYVTHHPIESLYYLTAINSSRDAFRFPVYHRLDVSLKYTGKIGIFTFRPYIQILNIYNQPNVLYYDFRGSPHKSLPIIPMAGLEIFLDLSQ